MEVEDERIPSIRCGDFHSLFRCALEPVDCIRLHGHGRALDAVQGLVNLPHECTECDERSRGRDGCDDVLHRLRAAADAEHVKCDGPGGADCGECVRPPVDYAAEGCPEHEEFPGDDEQVHGGRPCPCAGAVQAVA